MKKRKTWRSGLTVKEKRHLTEMGFRTKGHFATSVNYQKECREQDPNKFLLCHECFHIAHKLGMW